MTKNKLSIYLIKESVSDEKDILKNYGEKVTIRNAGIFYAERSANKIPTWKTNFFGNTLSTINYLFQSASKGVLLANVQIGSKKVLFALPFGIGRHMLKEAAIEERFGLLVTLNSVRPESIRSIEKSSLAANSKNSKEQISRPTKALDFGIDIEQELLRAVTGRSKYEILGKTVSGADMLSISVSNNVHNLSPLLQFCFKRYKSKGYEKDFEWVDQIKAIKNKSLIENLNEELLKKLNNKDVTDNIRAVIPDVIDWEDVEGFKFKPRQEELSNDIDILELIDSLNAEIELRKLRSRTIYVISASSGQPLKSWSFYKYIYAEIVYRKRQYILNSGKWYEVKNAFVKSINNLYNSIPISTIQLPEYNHDNEGSYNEAVCNGNANYLNMDKQNIMIGGGGNRIEFCDLYSKKKEIVHIKRAGGSAVLSHLFQQGINSGEAFIGEVEFRKKLNQKLIDGWTINAPEQRPNTAAYEIIYAIIDHGDTQRPQIPFFSKISLKNAQKRLGNLGYKLSLKHIRSLK